MGLADSRRPLALQGRLLAFRWSTAASPPLRDERDRRSGDWGPGSLVCVCGVTVLRSCESHRATAGGLLANSGPGWWLEGCRAPAPSSPWSSSQWPLAAVAPVQRPPRCAPTPRGPRMESKRRRHRGGRGDRVVLRLRRACGAVMPSAAPSIPRCWMRRWPTPASPAPRDDSRASRSLVARRRWSTSWNRFQGPPSSKRERRAAPLGHDARVGREVCLRQRGASAVSFQHLNYFCDGGLAV